MTASTVTTRFAPSPTGYLHLGNARTALFNFLFAGREAGRFLLRIEDTDRERSDERFVQALVEDLRWLGLDWEQDGMCRQSERGEVYAEHYARLGEQGLTYPCFCTREELALSRKANLAAGRPPRYSGKCAGLNAEQIEARLARGEQPTLRFRVLAGREVVFDDLVRGEQRFASQEIGDFIIRRADGTPAFFFTNAVDDALMGISHVFRGEDHLTNTPRQILLIEALGLTAPRYGHISMIVGGDGSPLSKRHGSLGLRDLRQAGFLPGAVNNYLARLGHYYGHDDYVGLDRLAAQFDPARLSRSPAGHDDGRLLFWQKEAVAHADFGTLWAWVDPATRDRVPQVDAEAFITAVRDNARLPEDIAHWAERVYAETLTWDEPARAAMQNAGADFFRAAVAALALHGTDFQALAGEVKQRTGTRGKALFMPLSAALTGELQGPELARLLPLIGVERARRRLEIGLSER